MASSDEEVRYKIPTIYHDEINHCCELDIETNQEEDHLESF